jgi:hypothetical protein
MSADQKYTKQQYDFVCSLIWGGIPVDRDWAEMSGLFKSMAPMILKTYPMLEKSFDEKMSKIRELQKDVFSHFTTEEILTGWKNGVSLGKMARLKNLDIEFMATPLDGKGDPLLDSEKKPVVRVDLNEVDYETLQLSYTDNKSRWDAYNKEWAVSDNWSDGKIVYRGDARECRRYLNGSNVYQSNYSKLKLFKIPWRHG